MQEFIQALRKATVAMHEMSDCWGGLSREDQDILNSFDQWGVAFNLSLDEVPFAMWSIVDKLEEMGGK